MRIGERLLQDSTIDEAALEFALRYQHSFGGRLGDVLVRLGLVTEDRLIEALGRHLQVPVVRIGARTVPPAVLAMIPERLLRRHAAFPVAVVPDRAGRARLAVAFAEPQHLPAIDELSFAAGVPVQALLAGRRDLEQAMARHFAPLPASEPVADRRAGIAVSDDDAPDAMQIVCARTSRGFRAIQ